MGALIRGVKNAFRNGIRTGSIILILGLSVGLALVMFIALTTIQAKIDSVKSNIGNTITISPAGARGFEGGGEPLTDAQLTGVKSLAHVVSIDETLNDRLNSSSTSLQSAIDAGTLGQRAFRFNRSQDDESNGSPFGGQSDQSNTPPANFTPPITVTGSTNAASIARSLSGSAPTFTNGSMFSADSNENVAVLGKALAAKNALSVGSTFKAYDTDIKVVGIFDAGNTFANGGLAMPIKTLQRLSDQAGQVSSATVTVDSITNLNSTTKAIQDKLGSAADVVSTQDTSNQALAPLENIKTISLYSLIGALAAGAVIIFLTMLMIVRERRREIGVLKAVGAGNGSIVTQFIAEACTFTLLGGVIGIFLGVLLSNPILGALTTNAAGSQATQAIAGGGRGGFGGGFGGFANAAQRGFGQVGNVLSSRQGLQNLHATTGWEIVLYGLAVALLIAIIGAAIPAYLTAKVRPAEVLRGE